MDFLEEFMIKVLISTYNGEKYLSEQLDSILVQSFQDFQIIIRDDSSKDKTLEIINEYRKNYPDKIFLMNETGNLGSTNSFFKLLMETESELYCFCDQDDYWKPNKLEKMVSFYEENCDKNQPVLIHTKADVVNSKLELMERETVKFNKNKFGMEKEFVWQIFQNDVTGCTVMINKRMKEVFSSVNFQDEKIIQHDWFLAQIAYLFGTKYIIPEEMIKYRQHGNNVIGSNQLSFFLRIKNKMKKGISYPYYDQLSALLKCNLSIDNQFKNEIESFVALKKESKIKRICWHLKHKYFRDGNILYKMYQLFIC